MANERALKMLDKAILYGFTSSAWKRPGYIIQCMSEEDRAILRGLTSDDAQQQRTDYPEVLP